MSGGFDILAVGDLGLEQRGVGVERNLGGAAARIAIHAAALGCKTGLVTKVGDDEAGRSAGEMMRRSKVDLRWVRASPGSRTTVFYEEPGPPPSWRVERGADAALRLDEVPVADAASAKMLVASGYSLAVEPARSAVHGALRIAASRQGRAALLLDAELLWQTNARMTRRLLEPAIGTTFTLALSMRDAAILFGAATEAREALTSLAGMGPRLIYLADDHGRVWLREGARTSIISEDGGRELRDRYAGPAAFWAGLAQGTGPRKAAEAAARYSRGIRRPGIPLILKS